MASTRSGPGMRNTWRAALVMGVVIMTASPSLAQERASLLGDRLNLTVGYSMWIAKWESPFFDQADAQVVQDNSEVSVMNGPVATVTYQLREGDWFNRVFTTFTWLQTGFDFRESGTLFQLEGSPGALGATVRDSVATRRDYSIGAGVTIWKGFGMFASYYDNKQEFTDRFAGLGDASTQFITKRLRGPVIGAFGAARVAERLNLYGNLGFAMLDFDSPGGGGTDAAQGYSTEVGVHIAGPRFWKVSPALQLGFRGQIITENFGPTTSAPIGNVQGFQNASIPAQQANDITWGPILSVTAQF
ncbi:MAG TPA: hypothetical protein EYN74_08800 [Nitrospirales bacterium]|nr:hypothetical protein [Nitrospirales bacterium]HIB54206.1 hypothetical protein [Nitrospirales bacterium]HIN32559.1 hypothetical protein [Nitrospirales bacterium]